MPPDLKRSNKKTYNENNNHNTNKRNLIELIVPRKMYRIKINRINYYILVSVMIHSFLFLFIEKERDITLGEKIIPIELVDDLSKAGFGEDTERSKRFIKNPSIKEELKKKD